MGGIRTIFSVDIFNEGVDVPEIDMIMFLRPTESPTVFLQQLGRGLRKQRHKEYVNVIDFIGNYKKANLIPYFLTGDLSDYANQRNSSTIPSDADYPDGCFIHFDLKLVNLFKHMAEHEKGIFNRIMDEYRRIYDEQGEKPLRLTMYTYMDENLYAALRNITNLNIFKDYLSFLDRLKEIDDDEKALLGSLGHKFLKVIENTRMSKLYKIPILLAFYNCGDMKLSINDDDIYRSFKSFYSVASNAIDMKKDQSTANFENWGKHEYVSLARNNPIHFLLQTHSEFFYENEGSFCLIQELDAYIRKPAFVKHFKDIIDYRTRKFYKERLEKRVKESLS